MIHLWLWIVPLMNYNDTKTLLDSLLFTATEQWNVSEEQIMENMNKIAFHESKYGTDKYTPIQEGGGPGRGMFQYETGEDQGAETAINRLINQLGYVPDFLEGIGEKGYDISGLTPEQQQSVFLADKLKDETASFKDVDTLGEVAEFWVDEHWAGYGEDMELRQKMIDKFLKDMSSYKT
jgi:hypothetical protein